MLVALGVIFIPMLLERGADDARLSVRMEIPAEPDIHFLDPSATASTQAPVKTPQPLEEALQKVRPAQQEEIAARDTPASTGQDTKPATGAAAAGKAGEKPQRELMAAESPSWVVQVGSFSRQANAEVLRDKLKSAGFAAFVESARSNTGPIYRVRIGPVADRQEAERLVKRLDSKGGYRGIVISYAEQN